jgi:uncharacterized membrane protein YfcA
VTPATYTLLAVVVAAAAFIQGTTGVGFALIVAPVLGFLAPEVLPACLLALMLPLNAYVAWRERAALDRTGAGWITAGRFVGTFGGLWVLAMLPPSRLDLVVGAVTVLAALATLAAPSFSPGRGAYVTAGLVTGVTETATGIGGPPLALAYQHRPAPVLRATLAFCFLVGQLVSIAVLAAGGRVGAPQLAAAAELLPALVVGAAFSRLAHRRVGGKILRVFVLAFAVVSGTLLLLRGAA